MLSRVFLSLLMMSLFAAGEAFADRAVCKASGPNSKFQSHSAITRLGNVRRRYARPFVKNACKTALRICKGKKRAAMRRAFRNGKRKKGIRLRRMVCLTKGAVVKYPRGRVKFRYPGLNRRTNF